MKILLTCDPGLPVPPPDYGGVERMVSGVCDEYARHGHEVFLVASKPSNQPSAKKIYNWAADRSAGTGNIFKNAVRLYNITREVAPDVIHSFSRLLFLYPLLLSGKIPILQSYGRRINLKSSGIAARLGWRNLYFSCCAQHMLNNIPDTRRWSVIGNFTDTNYFVPTGEKIADKDKYLLFLGRICQQKGVREAIDVARRTDNKLIIAGLKDEEYFTEHIEPLIDNRQIVFIGLVNDEQKLPLLQQAKALLFPINGPEAFGLVLVEAMACGVPVIGFNRYSVPEIIKHGENGFIADNVDEMVDAVNNLDSISTEKVRQDVVLRFDKGDISSQYLELFEKLLSKPRVL